MASAIANSDQSFFEAVANGSVGDLRKILEKEGLETTTKLAQSYNEMGETPLLVAIGKDHHDVMKFLVKVLKVDIGQTGRFIWNSVDCADFPPLLAAAISLQTDSTRNFIWRSHHRGKPLLDLASFLSSSTTCRHKINVLELMGATYLLEDSPDLRFDGLSYWMEAMTLKSSSVEIGHSWIPNHSSIPASEMITLEQLKRMINDELAFDQRLVIDRAILVSQRILDEMKLFPFTFIVSNFLYVLVPDIDQFQRLTKDDLHRLSNLTTNTFKKLKLWWEKGNLSGCTQMPFMKRAILLLFELLEDLRFFVDNHVLPFSDLMFALDFACEHLHRMYTKFWPSEEKRRSKEIDQMTRLVRDIAVLIFHALPKFSQQERQQFKQCLYHYVRLYRGSETDRPHLLHEACCLGHVFLQREADYEKFVQLLLDAGEDPNATDRHGNTPLHYLLAKNECKHCNTRWEVSDDEEHASIFNLNCMAVIKLLLASGCHIDQSNEGGVTNLELLKQTRRIGLRRNFAVDESFYQSFDESFDLYLESVINAVLPLTCYSAQSVRKHNLSTEQLPLALQLCVRRH